MSIQQYLDIVPYHPRHLDTLVPEAGDAHAYSLLEENPWWEGLAVSLRWKDTTVGVVALSLIGTSILVSLIGSAALRRMPRILAETAIVSLPRILALPGVERILINVDPERPATSRFASWLGFSRIDKWRMVYGRA